jgi:membrane-bound lytic murein transglycosylase D
LTSPAVPALPALEQVALVPRDELTDEEEPQRDVSELFTLEELKDKTDDAAELALPDVDLPQADIPLALNSKVEYFLTYFQTRGKQSFSRWLSRSSRYIPMMKEVLKHEGMPEDLVFVAMIESGFHLHARSVANAVGPWQFVSAPAGGIPCVSTSGPTNARTRSRQRSPPHCT